VSELTGESEADQVVTEETVITTETAKDLGSDRTQHALLWGAIAGIIAYLLWLKYEWLPHRKYPATPGATDQSDMNESAGLGQGLQVGGNGMTAHYGGLDGCFYVQCYYC
jgi:hypothetical protein